MNNSIKLAAIFFVLITGCGVAGYFYIASRTEGSYFKSEGVKIHYTDEGRGDAVVLVHGFAANSDINWRRPGLLDLLLDHGYRVITMDLRGHGLSDKPGASEEYGEKMIHDAPRLLQHLQIERAHLVGYSLGGFIALKAAIDYPDKWNSVTIMASGWENPEGSNSFDALKRAMEDFKSGKPVGPLINYFDETGEMKTGFLHTQLFKILTTYLNDREALMAVMKSADGLGVKREQLVAVKIPLCGIIGSKDPFLNKAKAIEDIIPEYHLVIIDGADHITTMTSSAAKHALVDFLDNVSLPEQASDER